MKRTLSSLALATALVASADTIDIAEFNYRAPVTFPGYTLEDALANFPVLVRLADTQSGFSYATSSADGSDIRFALEDGTILPSEVALWDTTGESQVWVSVPSLAQGASIVMYWGGDHAFPASQTDGSVWTTAGYFGVWHMDEASGATTAKDSAGGALDGTYNVTSVGETGKAGRSVRISNGGWNVADGKGIATSTYSDIGNQFMVSLWCKYPNQNPGTDRLLSHKAAHTDANGWEISSQRYDQSKIDVRGGGSTTPQPPVVLKNKDWQLLTFVFNGKTCTTYVDNSWKQNGTIEAAVDNNVVLAIGNRPGLTGDSFKGWLDEVRLYRGIPAREWITTECNSVRDASFAAVGTRESLATDEPTPGALATATVSLHSAALSWGLSRPGSSSADVRIEYGTQSGIYTATNIVATAATAATSGTESLTGLLCGTTYYARLVAENASGAVPTAEISFATQGAPTFSDVSLAAAGEGALAATASLTAPNEDATTAVSLFFSLAAGTATQQGSWTASTSPETFTKTFSGLSLGTYAAHFEAESTCSVCGNVLTVPSETSTATLAGECRWTGNAGENSWNTPGNWSSLTVPGPLDTAVFGSEASVSGSTISLDADQSVKELVVESAGTLVIGSADDKNAPYSLSAAHVVRTGEGAGQLAFGVPFVFSAAEDGTNTLVAATAVRFNGSCGSATAGPLRKTGTSTVTLASALSGSGPVFLVEEGELAATAANSLKGSATVGGHETAARLTFSRDDVISGSGVGTLTVLTNGTAQIRRTDWGHFYTSFIVRDGGTIGCNDYTYVLNARFRGSSISCNGNLYASGYWQQGLTSEASDHTSWLRGGMTFNPSDTSGSTAAITVNNGAAPVDFVITGSIIFSGGTTSKVLEKNGAGTLRMTGTSGVNTTGTTKLNAGTLLCDNMSGTPLGNAPLRVYGDATLGGRGFIGGTERGNVTVAGSSTKTATIAPGSIDEETGLHLYGTLTVGSESQTNSVALGNYTCLKAGVGPKDAETRLSTADQLKVFGAVTINAENTTLDLVTNTASLDTVAGGTYTLVEADEITGEFATVLTPKTGWAIAYESETVDGADVVKRITLTVPPAETVIVIR